MKTAKYHCKQAELYTIAYFVLKAVSSKLARFTAFKGKYVAAYVNDLVTQVDNAASEPDEQQRSEEHETIRVALVKLVADALTMFSAMERYIVEVFAKDVQQIKIDAAGGTYYTAAFNNDFDACEELLKELKTFTTDNETLLLNGGLNMPADFLTNLTALKTSFSQTHINFLGSEGGAEIGTDSKIDLNNAVYEQIITAINADAQAIFVTRADDAIRQQFVFEHQLQLVRGAGVAGIRLHTIDNIAEEDLADVQAIVNPGNHILTTDLNGRDLLLQLAAGDYTIQLSKSGYVTQTITVTVEKGTVKRVDVTMVKV